MKNKTKVTGFRSFLIILYIITSCVLLYYLVDGFSFYSTSISNRPHHEDYRDLRPAGNRGHGLGILGSFMMILLLLYSVRKRTKLFGRVGSIDKWLDIHIYLGLMGPLFIILHTSFKVNGLIAISFWAMIATVLSGIVGRYLYSLIPHNVVGEDVNITELIKYNQKLSLHLKKIFKISNAIISKIDHLGIDAKERDRGALYVLFSMVCDDLIRNRKTKRIVKNFTLRLKVPRNYLNQINRIIYKKVVLSKRILLLNKTQDLFHYWHVIHKPATIIMFIVMAIHVATSIIMGYKWLF